MSKEPIREYREFKDDYAYDGGIFCNDTAKVRAAKRIVAHDLEEWERVFILTYAECGSVRELGEIFHISRHAAWSRVHAIREKIESKL